MHTYVINNVMQLSYAIKDIQKPKNKKQKKQRNRKLNTKQEEETYLQSDSNF